MDLNKYINIYTEAIGFFGRYFIIAGAVYYFFYKYKKDEFSSRKLQNEFPDKKQIRFEIVYSIIALAIYCCVSYVVLKLYSLKLTSIYLNISEFGWPYFFLSIMVLILLHDTYFYWTHRLLHLPWLYKNIHLTHHLSYNPTPWAAFLFHPIEAIISSLYLPVSIIFIPLHPFVIIFFLFYMTLINVMGHTGYEWFSEKFRLSRIGKWQNTSTLHNIHHKNGEVNFGLYFTFWDKLMKTLKTN